MPITTTCGKCNCKIEFPDCPNADTDKWERLAFSLYSTFANEPDELRLCGNCRPKRKVRKR